MRNTALALALGINVAVIDATTADFRYARLHADQAIYPHGHYEPADLDPAGAGA